MWSAYLFKTISGALGPRIYPHSVSWNITINEIESIDLTLEKSAMPKLASNLWIEPWWAGVVLMYNGIPIVAGPIVNRPIETKSSLRIMAQGPRALFGRRMAIRDMTNWADLKNTTKVEAWSSHSTPNQADTTRFKQKTYPSLLRMVIAESMTKYGGGLPIVFKVPILNQSPVDNLDPEDGQPYEPFDKPHDLHIWGSMLNESTVETQINSLINLEKGPDIFFKPTLTKDYSLQWEFWSGRTDDDKELPDESDTIWDTTSASGAVSNMTVNYLGTSMNNRAFVRHSAGSGGGQTIRMRENRDKMIAGYPLLESYEVITAPNASVVDLRAKANLYANDKANHQINATVRADGPQKLGTYWPGEYSRLITSGWYGLRNGETRAKIISISGDFSNNIEISFKETEVL